MRGTPFRIALIPVMVCMVGCATVGPDFQRPRAALPERWDDNSLAVHVTWWRGFDDPELSSLVERAAASNLDIRIATTRWMQARAARRVTGSGTAPSVDASGSYQRARSSENGLLDISGLDGKKNFSVWQPGVGASWELDLWGRVRREVESANAGVQASADLRRGVLLVVVAETARDYLQLRGNQAQQSIVRQNLQMARHSQRLTAVRLADGVATRLDAAEASAQVSMIEAQLPALENERVRLVNALGLLLGEPPRALAHELEAVAPLPPIPASVPLGLPSELAERRPDIRAAEARLHAATADLGVAAGAFYPKLTLSANVGLQATHADDLGTWASHVFGVGPAFSVPIFEGGRLKGQLALRDAQQQEAMLDFQRTVLNAWHEVDDAMSDYGSRQARHAKLAETVGQDRVALETANRQYVAGATDFLQVLTVQRDLLAAQQALAASATEVSTSLVALYEALGGGWETTYPTGLDTAATE